MTPRMTRLKFLELAMEGAASRLVGAQGLNETQYAALHADANYIDARLKDERKRLALKERNKGALATAFDRSRHKPHTLIVGVTPFDYGKEYDPRTNECKDGWER